MKVLVTVKEVAEVADDFQIEDGRIPETYVDFDLNEWDEYAVEEAVQIKEAGDDVEVVTATIGPERCEETIRMALAKGADRAIRIWDEEIADRDLLDVTAKTELFRAVVDTEDPDLVLTGVQANDDSFGATGVSLAAAVGFEWAAVVSALDLETTDGVAHVHRELEGGLEELTDVDLPAVLTIQTGINEPRYASLRGIRQAQSKEIAVQTLDDIGLTTDDVAGDLELLDLYEPKTESEATYFEGDATEQAGQLAEVLRDMGVAAE